jgi:hypothetical protein
MNPLTTGQTGTTETQNMSMRRAYPEHSKGLAEHSSMQKLDHMIKPGTTAHTYMYIYIYKNIHTPELQQQPS